jgi:hypothetical protein
LRAVSRLTPWVFSISSTSTELRQGPVLRNEVTISDAIFYSFVTLRI